MATVESRVNAVLPAGIAPTLDWLREAEAWMRRHVQYRYDHENVELGKPLDEWRTLLPEIVRRVEAGDRRPVEDDCDAWSMTMINIARRAGVPYANCRLLLVLSPWGQLGSQPLDHMVGAVQLDGKWYVVGDTFTHIGLCYPAEKCPHRLYMAHRLPIYRNDWYKVDSWSDLIRG